MGELWGVYCGHFIEYWLRYNGFVLYHVMLGWLCTSCHPSVMTSWKWRHMDAMASQIIHIDCLLRLATKEPSKLRITVPWESTGHQWIPPERASNEEGGTMACRLNAVIKYQFKFTWKKKHISVQFWSQIWSHCARRADLWFLHVSWIQWSEWSEITIGLWVRWCLPFAERPYFQQYVCIMLKTTMSCNEKWRSGTTAQVAIVAIPLHFVWGYLYIHQSSTTPQQS